MAEKSYLTELTSSEQAATKIIDAAQEHRDRRLKQAKFDADQELEALKRELDAQYEEAAKLDATGVDPELQALQQDYRKKADEVVKTFEKSKAEAVEFLVKACFEVNLEVPKVVIGKFD